MHGIMQIPQNNNIRKHEKPILPLPSIVNFVLVMAAERRKTAAIAGGFYNETADNGSRPVVREQGVIRNFSSSTLLRRMPCKDKVQSQ